MSEQKTENNEKKEENGELQIYITKLKTQLEKKRNESSENVQKKYFITNNYFY